MLQQYSIKQIKFICQSYSCHIWMTQYGFHTSLTFCPFFFFFLSQILLSVLPTVTWKRRSFHLLDIHNAIFPRVVGFFFILWIAFYHCTKQQWCFGFFEYSLNIWIYIKQLFPRSSRFFFYTLNNFQTLLIQSGYFDLF